MKIRRYLLIGKEHAGFLKKMSEFSIRKFTKYLLVISLILCFAKLFRYYINNDIENLKYPFIRTPLNLFK
jgi:hypothetical protein